MATKAMQEVTIAEIVLERGRIASAWERLGVELEDGAPANGKDRDTDESELLSDKIDLQHKVLLAIKDGRVDPVAAATAVLGTEALGEH